LRPGDRLVVFDGMGIEYVAELEAVTPTQTAARIIETHRGLSPPLSLALLQGVPKGTKMDAIVRMGTELGVTEFIPFISARTVAAGRGRLERWRRIAVEAAKQCRRSDVPAVHPPVPLPAALDRVAGYDLVLLLWEGEGSRTIAQALAANGRARRVGIVIGPEGGFASEEVAQAAARGAVPVTIGPLILRTETAGAAALAMVSYELMLRPAAGSR
jgi:16S rRNA (uracil1498-N3)-methyltransferase